MKGTWVILILDIEIRSNIQEKICAIVSINICSSFPGEINTEVVLTIHHIPMTVGDLNLRTLVVMREGRPREGLWGIEGVKT